jgi:hypothetical protein
MRLHALRLALVFLGATGCARHSEYTPKLNPAQMPVVQPAIASRALLLITLPFETYAVQSADGERYKFGESTTAALSDLVTQSFVHGEVRRVSAAQALQWIIVAPDPSVADVLLVPSFDPGTGIAEAFDQTDVQLRIDVRCLKTGRGFSWLTRGHIMAVFSSPKGRSGSVLEQALRGLSDSLASHRHDLEATLVARH